MNGGHPQVGGARVKHHREGLRGGPQANLTIILCLDKRANMSVIVSNHNYQFPDNLEIYWSFLDSELLNKRKKKKREHIILELILCFQEKRLA